MADNKKPVSAAAKKAASRKVWRRVGICAAVLVVIALVLVSYFTSSTYYRSATAVEIGEHKLSVADFNYYYRTAVQNVYNDINSTYGDYASMILDPSKSLKDQQYSEGQSWEDYLTGVTLDNLTEIYAVYDEAVENGYSISQEGAANIDEAVENLRSAAKDAGYSLDNYLTAVYGKGVNAKVFRSLLTLLTTSTEYTDKVKADISYTDAEADAYYEEHSRDIDSVSAYLYTFSYGDPEAEDYVEGTRTKEEVQAIADGLLEAEHTALGYSDYIQANLNETEAADYDMNKIFYQGLQYSALNNAGLADWLFDDGRANGDMGWVEGDGLYYLLFFVGRYDNDYDTVNMRHILIKPVTDDEGNEVENAMDEARATLEEIYTDWKSDEATEDQFAILANLYSEDGDGTTGGLYENVTHGQMVDPIDNWLFDEGRQVGDYEFIETDYGWHLVYFSGYGNNYKDQLVDDAIRTERFNAWHEAAVEGYEAKTVEPGFGLTR